MTMHRHAGPVAVFLAHTLFIALCVTVSGCIHQDQNMRPSSEALQAKIDSFVSAWPKAEIAVALIDPGNRHARFDTGRPGFSCRQHYEGTRADRGIPAGRGGPVFP